MSATDLAAVIIAMASLCTVAVLVWLITDLRRTADELHRVVGEAQEQLNASLARLDDQAEAVDHELYRVDGLLDAAERVSARADTLSKVTYGAVAKPVIKTAAVVKGTSRAARRIRRGGTASIADDDATRRTG